MTQTKSNISDRAAETCIAFVQDLIEQARLNVNDCRLDYIDLQSDKGELSMLIDQLGMAPIEWHPAPCKHPKVRLQ